MFSNIFWLVKTGAKLMLTTDLISTDPHAVSHGALVLVDVRYRKLWLLAFFFLFECNMNLELVFSITESFFVVMLD